MRTTIDLPDDLHAIASSLAHDRGCTLSSAVVDLLRRALGPSTKVETVDQRNAAGDVAAAMTRIHALRRHVFWPDDLQYTRDIVDGLVGDRQVTNAYLCHLASSRHGTLATFDRGLAAAHPDRSVLVPVG